MSLTKINADNAPAALGPYSHAVKANGVVYTSGQIPINPASGELVQGSIKEQTEQVLKNLEVVLKASGSDFQKVLKTTVFLKDMNDFTQVNEVYEAAFAPHKPARSCVQVSRLPKDVAVEIECVALTD
ncbi:endoribonuclease L-PSP [Sporodiniella umbellata]|nr:endoribonuclease L-PSP [Sporodiniella umbellata]